MILGSHRFRIVVARLDKFLDAFACFISGIDDIFVRYKYAYEVIESNVLDILLGVLYLKVHRLWI